MNYVNLFKRESDASMYAERWVLVGSTWHMIRCFENGNWQDDPTYSPIADSIMGEYEKCFDSVSRGTGEPERTMTYDAAGMIPVGLSESMWDGE